MPSHDLLDQLVPPPLTGRRRLVAASVVVAGVLLVAAAWWSGLLDPNLAPISGYGWGPTAPLAQLDGTSGTVEVQLELDNRGAMDARIDELHAPHLTAAQVHLDTPVTIPAGDRARLTFHLDIEDCDRFDAPRDPLLTYSGGSGPLPVAGRSLPLRVHHVATEGDPDGWGRPGWWHQLARSVCDPEAELAP